MSVFTPRTATFFSHLLTTFPPSAHLPHAHDARGKTLDNKYPDLIIDGAPFDTIHVFVFSGAQINWQDTDSPPPVLIQHQHTTRQCLPLVQYTYSMQCPAHLTGSVQTLCNHMQKYEHGRAKKVGRPVGD